MKNIIQHDLRFPSASQNDAFTPASRALVRGLLEPQISDRIGCRRDLDKEIRESDWFADYNWHGVVFRESPPPWIPRLRDQTDIANF